MVLLALALAFATRWLPSRPSIDELPALFTSVSLFLVAQPPGLPELRPAVFAVVVAGGVGALVLAWRLGHSSWQKSAWSALCVAAGMLGVAGELCL